MEKDFQIGGVEFQMTKLHAFKQFHITRRLGPILGDLLPAIKAMKGKKVEELSEDEKLEQLAQIAEPIMTGLAKLSDKDADFVFLGLLSCVEMKQAEFGNWAKVSNGERLNFENLEIGVLLQVAGRALMYNLSGFFGAVPQVSHGGK